MKWIYVIFIILLLPAILPPDFIEEPPLPDPCNGSSELCERRYSEVSFPETHNAHASLDVTFRTTSGAEYQWILQAANHRYNMTMQYDAGFRAFMIDAHHRTPGITDFTNTSFCHGTYSAGFAPCSYGYQEGVHLLTELHQKMNETPRDIVTLLIEVYVPYENIEYIFEQSGLIDLVYVHELGSPWPTLSEMIESGKRLVVFIESADDPLYPWLHDFGTHSWTTNYAEKSSSEMKCDFYRGESSAEVWHMNNWLSDASGLSTWIGAAEVNEYNFLLQRSIDCWEMHGSRPTFVAVDWWSDGQAVNVTKTLNAMNHWSDDPPRLETTDSK